MYLKKLITLVTIAFSLNLFLLDQSNAVGIGVWCQVRGDERSKVKVKGRGLPPGKYFAKIFSGGVWVQSRVKPATKRQIEFEFDSNSEDDEPGGSLISPAFIKNLKVLGLIRNAKSKRLIAKMTDSCEFREK